MLTVTLVLLKRTFESVVDSLAVKYSEFSTTESSMVVIDAVAEVAPGGNVTVIAVDGKSDPPVHYIEISGWYSLYQSDTTFYIRCRCENTHT